MNLQQLAYPLNVYASLLQLAYGCADSLHFGLGHPGQNQTGSDQPPGYPAMQRATRALLCACLPEEPVVIVDAGCGLGSLAAQLSGQGHRVLAISNNAEEARIARINAPEADVLLADFAALRPSETADVVVMEHSAQYFDSLLLLSRAREWLRSGGSLVLLDEFVLQDHAPLCNGRPLLAHFLQQVVRSGFTIVAARNLGAEIAPGLRHLGHLLRQYQQPLMAATGIDSGQVSDLADGFTLQAEHMATEVTGYVLLTLRCPPLDESRLVLGNIHSFDMAEVQPLFESSFDSRFDPDLWQWKYGGGRGHAVAARRGGQLVAHYGGISRDIVYFGQPRQAMQICDVMVMPEYRSFVSRDTLFFRTAATFLEQHVGNTGSHLQGFGFPNQRVLRMARRLGLYDVTDSFIELQYPLPDHPQELPGFLLQRFALEDPAGQTAVDGLWQGMAGAFADHIIGVRDWSYLHYRYCSHPLWRREYDSFLVTGPQGLVLAILKQVPGACLLMDIVGAPTAFPGALQALVGWLARDEKRLLCRITHDHAERLMLPGVHVQSLDIGIPCSAWTRGPDPESLRGRWWLTAGDMDFV